MAFMVVCSAAAAMLLTLSVFSGSLQRYRVKNQQIRHMKGDTIYLDEELERSFSQRYIQPFLKRLRGAFARAGKGRRRDGKARKGNPKLEQQLRLAGMHVGAQEYTLLRMVLAGGAVVLGLGAGALLTSDAGLQLLILLFALAMAVLMPRLVVSGRVKSRQRAIQNQMPNVMDVLCVSIEAGLGFDAALLKVIERFSGPLIDELSQVYREVQMGRPRREALTGLSQRSNVTELQTFASAVIQSEQFGTPMKNVLRTQAQQLRVSRRQQAQEKGMKAPIRMMLPMVILIFPVIFIILLGPTVINVIAQFT